MLDAAETLADLLVPPGNRLEKLTGDRAGQHSIRINRQWRICFLWSDAGPEDVEVVAPPDAGAASAARPMPVHTSAGTGASPPPAPGCQRAVKPDLPGGQAAPTAASTVQPMARGTRQ